jgi:hypothetical protein
MVKIIHLGDRNSLSQALCSEHLGMGLVAQASPDAPVEILVPLSREVSFEPALFFWPFGCLRSSRSIMPAIFEPVHRINMGQPLV